ncbi:MAG: hypothetical protein KAH23_04460 [Kiritimatiellae bacterium]|nr:hypothetical protein [Kiritimatiellia bacterium]
MTVPAMAPEEAEERVAAKETEEEMVGVEARVAKMGPETGMALVEDRVAQDKAEAEAAAGVAATDKFIS